MQRVRHGISWLLFRYDLQTKLLDAQSIHSSREIRCYGIAYGSPEVYLTVPKWATAFEVALGYGLSHI